MGGVQGWWDEVADPEAEDALDALVKAGAPDEDAQPVDEPVQKEDVEALKEKVTNMVANPSTTTGTTYTWQWAGLSGATGKMHPTYTVPSIEAMYTTKAEYERLKKQEKALKALAIAAGELATSVGGLPSKEFKTMKAQHKLVTEVLSEMNHDRLV